MKSRPEFRSDNTAPAHPAVLAAIADANSGPAGAYGDDPWTASAHDWFRRQFGDNCAAFLMWNGTGSNVAALRAITRPWQAVITSEHAHINVDECGAPELVAGIKLLDLPSHDGKLTVEQVKEAGSRGVGFEHHVQPRVVSLTQSTEYGTIYSRDELGAICDAAHEAGMLVHLDGSRLANAAAALGASLSEVSTAAGVDVLSFGLTKNGGMGAEAVVFRDKALAEDFRYVRKQSMQLASKMRFVSAQLLALYDGDLWLRTARHANAMAQRLAGGLAGIPGVELLFPVDSNQLFARFPAGVAHWLNEEGFLFYAEMLNGASRLVTAWSTTEEEVDGFLAAARTAVTGA